MVVFKIEPKPHLGSQADRPLVHKGLMLVDVGEKWAQGCYASISSIVRTCN